ncbi:hypothetical protein BZA70DRAFT_50307 [Myxozyma melibiosi]|uniref:RGS domain-containing protein n=1 Tax=Myxozyma melibiosi TaxID=54550 RepID=A0ABR1FEX6_9ASCO
MPRMRSSSRAGMMLLGLGRHDEQPLPEVPPIEQQSQPSYQPANTSSSSGAAPKRTFQAADLSSLSSSSSTASSSPSNSEPASPIYAVSSLPPSASYFQQGFVPTSAPSLWPPTSSSSSSQQGTHHPHYFYSTGHRQSISKRLPSLDEVLADESAPPFSLTEFMAYLAQNHCLETLEFTMDVQRYREVYENAVTMSRLNDSHPHNNVLGSSLNDKITSGHREFDHLMLLWHRIVDSYVQRESPRELNLPADVRDELLDMHETIGAPPRPEMLDEAVSAAKDLMNESVFMRFLNDTQNSLSLMHSEEGSIPTSVGSNSSSSSGNQHGPWRFPSLHRQTGSGSMSSGGNSSGSNGFGNGYSRSRINSRSHHDIAPDQQVHVESEDESSLSTRSSPMTPPESPELDMTDEEMHGTLSFNNSANSAGSSSGSSRHGPWRRMSKRFKWRAGSAGAE